ncbi:taste receptor type 2 member 7-like [Pelobates fuscus]|uniref:taste receptor type 2 member 7-like n=1 Tax=Pelobates fuscus TaxID=191477 RepID=UPI002FE4B4B9
MVANELCIIFFQDFYSQTTVVNTFIAILSSLFFSSLLFSVCLCFYYFVKILQLNHPFFLQLKTKITTITYWLLVGSLFVSVAIGLPSYWDLYREPPEVTSLSKNGTGSFNYHLLSHCHCLIYVYLLFAFIAFILFILLTLSIIISLCWHMRAIQMNTEGNGGTNIHAHLTAAKTLISLLLLYIIFFLSVSCVFNIAAVGGSVIFSLSLLMISSFPFLNSVILILGNSKMRTSMKKLLLTLTKHCWDDRNITGDSNVTDTLASKYEHTM